MTVRELIAALSRMPPDTWVFTRDRNGRYFSEGAAPTLHNLFEVDAGQWESTEWLLPKDRKALEDRDEICQGVVI